LTDKQRLEEIKERFTKRKRKGGNRMKTLYCPNCGNIEFVANHARRDKARCSECGGMKLYNLHIPTIVKVNLIKKAAKTGGTAE